MFESMSSGVAIYQAVDQGKDFVFVDFNSASERMEKIKREDLIGKSLIKTFPQVEKFGLLEKIRQVWNTGEPEHFPLAFYKDDRVNGWRENWISRLPSGEIVVVYDDLTAQKQAEIALKTSERRLRSYFDQNLFGMAITSIDKGWVEVNKTLLEMFGYSRDELKNLTWAELTYPDDLEADVFHFNRMLAGEINKYSLEKRFIRKDGTLVHTNVSVNAIRKADGSVDNIMALINDITPRKKAEIALEESERYFRTLLHSLHEDIIVIDKEYRIVDVNKSFVTSTGQSREQVIGRFCYKVSHNRKTPCGNSEGNPCMLQQVFKTGEAKSCKHTHKKANGSSVMVDVLLSPLKDADGNVTHVVEAIRDITDMVAAQKERDQLVTAIEQSADTIVVTDLQGSMQYVNPSFERITGFTRLEAIGQNPRVLQSGVHDFEFYERMWNVLTQGKTWNGRFVNKKKDGTLYSEDATITPVLESNGNIINFVAVKRDVTEKLKLEKRYRQSQKEESIGRLAGGVAHDLNNLLTPILGYSELLQGDFGPGDSRRDAVDEIMHAGLRARDLVRQLLAFSRKQTLEYKSINIGNVVTGLEKLLRRTIREDIEINILLSPEIPDIMADMGQIEQVLMNLTVNAADAMVEGGRLTIEVGYIFFEENNSIEHQEIEQGHYVFLSVSDTGCGINEETKKNMFEPFYSTKGDQGTGLGLATVYGIVKQHGGFIHVKSEIGIGSSFEIYLPISMELPTTSKNIDSVILAPKGTETILLVEDDKRVRELTLTLLKQQGYLVLAASDGTEALAIVKSLGGQVDLLLTDVVMPDINGKELYEEIRNLYPSIKVLFMSGYTNDVITNHGILGQDINFIQKPFSIHGLAGKVRDALSK